MKEAFIEKNFKPQTMAVIEQAVEIIEEYRVQGYVLTLRQLYYQFVARDLVPNTQRSYDRLGRIINDARMTGYIDWDLIEDRTRNLEKRWTFAGPREAIQQMRKQYFIDMWSNQGTRVEVWIEKEALVGIIEPVCRELDIAYFACRGYVSQSEQYKAGLRSRSRFNRETQETVILHLGDHDPSGMDMTRDNKDRLRIFAGYRGQPTVVRIALNMDQVEEYGPPPNFAKQTDARFEGYFREYGDESWELDALEPTVIDALIREHVDNYRDMGLWAEKEAQLAEEEEILDDIIERLED